MSKRETSGDATGYKRGEKGFANASDNGKFLKSDYKKELLYVKAVGQIATVGDNEKQKQRGW